MKCGQLSVVGKTQFCAGYTDEGVYDQDTCKSDSGSPIVHSVSGALLGVVSAGVPYCTEDGPPSVYANVTSLRDFIDKHMG